MTRWRIPCSVCGGVFAIWEADALPKRSDQVDWSHVRDLSGHPISGTDEVKCYSCGARVNPSPPETWEVAS